MPRLTFDLQPVGPWRGTLEEHNANMVEIYGERAAKTLTPCSCGYYVEGILCACWPEQRTTEHGRQKLEAHYRREHLKGLKAKREFPALPRCPLGTCYWCRKPIVHGRAKQRSMHDGRKDEPDCAYQYHLRTRPETQARYLLDRDGIGCKVCGKVHGRWQCVWTAATPERLDAWWAQDGWLKRQMTEKPGPFSWASWETYLEVDHVIPLAAAWEAFGGEPERMRWFHGPRNLQLLCPNVAGSDACHAAKTKIDTAFIRECQRNGPEWAKAEILNRLGVAGLLKSTETPSP